MPAQWPTRVPAAHRDKHLGIDPGIQALRFLKEPWAGRQGDLHRPGTIPTSSVCQAALLCWVQHGRRHQEMVLCIFQKQIKSDPRLPTSGLMSNSPCHY